jgi:hypothetical protein
MVRRIFSVLRVDYDWLVSEAKRTKTSAAAVVRSLIKAARERGTLS